MKAILLAAALCVSGTLAWTADRHNVPEIMTKVPECTERELNWLWPDFDDATRFYQCGAIGWIHHRHCAGGTWFLFDYQVCVHPWEWVSPSPPTQPTLPTPSPTPTGRPPWWSRPPRPSRTTPPVVPGPSTPDPTPAPPPQGPPPAPIPPPGPVPPPPLPTPAPTLPTPGPTLPTPAPTP